MKQEQDTIKKRNIQTEELQEIKNMIEHHETRKISVEGLKDKVEEISWKVEKKYTSQKIREDQNIGGQLQEIHHLVEIKKHRREKLKDRNQ